MKIVLASQHKRQPSKSLSRFVDNSEAREWCHDSDKTQTNKLQWWTILKISLREKPVFLKHLWKKNFAYIPCISLRKRFCWPSLAGNSVICILFLDFVRFAIENTDSSLKVHALHYANELYASDLPLKNFWKLAKQAEAIRNSAKEGWGYD